MVVGHNQELNENYFTLIHIGNTFFLQKLDDYWSEIKLPGSYLDIND